MPRSVNRIDYITKEKFVELTKIIKKLDEKDVLSLIFDVATQTGQTVISSELLKKKFLKDHDVKKESVKDENYSELFSRIKRKLSRKMVAIKSSLENINFLGISTVRNRFKYRIKSLPELAKKLDKKLPTETASLAVIRNTLNISIVNTIVTNDNSQLTLPPLESTKLPPLNAISSQLNNPTLPPISTIFFSISTPPPQHTRTNVIHVSGILNTKSAEQAANKNEITVSEEESDPSDIESSECEYN